jgi:hypothetical protein
MGKFARDKGRRGQTAAKALLTSRDWAIAELAAGIDSEDVLATDPSGTLWAVEVKNCAGILPAHLKQAMEQGKRRRARWMLMNKLEGTSSWLVRRQGYAPVVWHERGEDGSA